MKILYRSLLPFLLAATLAACSSSAASVSNPTAVQPARTALPTGVTKSTSVQTDTPGSPTTQSTPAAPSTDASSAATTLAATLPAAPLPTASPTSRPTLKPDEWKTLPVVPTVSERVVEIFHSGLALGNNPQAFSKIGDCGSTPAWFLGDFDRGSRYYRLGEYTQLEAVIWQYQGSFDRTSLAARSGFNASALFVPLWADRTYCLADETPLACEYRDHRPSIAFIMLGTNDIWRPDEFEPQMRNIIEFSINKGIIPVLSTKADNQEGDGSINATIARLAQEYDLPLWNFWAAVQPLPNGGLQEDGAHLTFGRNLFDDPEAMQTAWTVRNLTALQVLDAVWLKLSQ